MKMTAMEIYSGTEDAAIAKREGRKELIHSALIILAVAILATLPGWLPGMIFSGRDYTSVALRGAVDYAAQRLRDGEIPLWNPNVGLGAPVLGDGQTGVFFPTMLLHVLLLSKLAWVAGAVVMMWLGGFGIVVLFKSGSFKRAQASMPAEGSHVLFPALVFLGTCLCMGAGARSAGNAVALTPWVLLASAGLLRRISAARLVGTTLLMSLIFLGGTIGAGIGVVAASLIYLIWLHVRGPRQWGGFVGAILTLTAASLVAALVAAVQWMPTIYNASLQGIHGFVFQGSGGLIVLAAPLEMLALAVLLWRVAGRLTERRDVLLKWLFPVMLVGAGATINSGRWVAPKMREAVDWVQKQNDPGKFIAEGDNAWAIPTNVLAPAVTPQRTGLWLEVVGKISGLQRHFEEIDHPALRLLGVKYLITNRKLEPTTRPATAPAPTRRLFVRELAPTPMGKMEWKPVWPTTRSSGEVMVYENVAQPLPRFWLARNAEYVSSAKEALERVKKGDFDPHEVVIVDRETEAQSAAFAFARRPPVGTGRGSLQILEDSPERIRIGTEGAGGWLVLADAYAPGWTAHMSYTVSQRSSRRGPPVARSYEQALTIVPAYGALRAVALAGGAEVVFEYEPKGWKHGLMVAGIGAIVLLLMVGGMMFPAEKSEDRSQKTEGTFGTKLD